MNAENKQRMGFLSVIAFVIGLQLGSALFLLPEQLHPYGAWGALSWLISGTGALSLSLIFATLSKTDPAFGGPSVYIEKAFGKQASFYSAWAYWFVSWFSSVPLLLLAISSLETLLGQTCSLLTKIFIGTLMLTCITVLNLYGAIISGFGEILFAVFKILPWIVLPIAILINHQLPAPTWAITDAPLHAIGVSSLLTFWGFIGLEASTTIMDVVKRPEKILPFALCFGTACVVIVYFVNTWVAMAVVEPGVNPLNALMKQLMGPIGSAVFSSVAMMMCLGTLNSWLLASGQMVSVAFKTKLIPRALPKSIDSTIFGVILTSCLMWITTVYIQIQNSENILSQVIELCCAIFIVIYFACITALIRFIIKKEVSAAWWTWVAIAVASLFSIWTLAAVSVCFWIVLGALGVTGYGVKYFLSKSFE